MPKIVDHETYRRELVAQATALFAEQGYHGLSVRDIAAGLGISKSALYHYFPSKEALFHAVVDAAVTVELSGMDRFAAGAETPRQRLAALLRYCVAREKELAQEIALLLDATRPTADGPGVDPRLLGRANDAYVDFVQQYLGLRERPAAVALVATVSGLVLHRMVDDGHTDFEETADWLLRRFPLTDQGL